MTGTQEIQITAEPQLDNRSCLFRVDRSLYLGTLYTSDRDFAREHASLIHAVFEVDENILGVQVRHGELLVTLRQPPEDWRPLARAIGAAIRAHLQANKPVIAEDAPEHLQGSDLLRWKAQQVIDTQLNPALAAHGGFVEIARNEGNDLFITMGGGCQGCGSAVATLRQGVEVALREAVPELGAIHDVTDHAAGLNPYM